VLFKPVLFKPVLFKPVLFKPVLFKPVLFKLVLLLLPGLNLHIYSIFILIHMLLSGLVSNSSTCREKFMLCMWR
jgi:hypothetical protein